MGEIQLTRIKSIYGDLKGLSGEIHKTSELFIDEFLVNQINDTLDRLTTISGTDYSSYKIPQERKLGVLNNAYPIIIVKMQVSRVISRLEEEYSFGTSKQNHTNVSEEIVKENPEQTEPDFLYIKESVIDLIKNKQDGFNYKKLHSLVKELNKNYLNENALSCLALIRAITDHIPPLLGYDTFEEIVNNYKWSRTDKQYIIKLFDDRPISDDTLHRTISTSDDLIDMTNIPNNQFLNRLIQECLEKTVSPGIKHKEEIKPQNETKIKKITNPEIRPIVRAELLSRTGGPDGYFVEFSLRNVGKGLALLKELVLGDAKVPLSSISLAENEQYTTTMNITDSILRKGELENPEFIIDYENIDSNKFQTTYKINLELRADKLYNLQSFTDPRFSQVS